MSQSSQSHPIRIPHGVRQICPLLLADRRTCSVSTLGCGNDALATSNHVIPPTSSLFGGHDRLPTFLVHIPHTSFVAVPNAALLALPGGLLFGSSFPPLFSSHSTTSCQDQFAVLEKKPIELIKHTSIRRRKLANFYWTYQIKSTLTPCRMKSHLQA